MLVGIYLEQYKKRVEPWCCHYMLTLLWIGPSWSVTHTSTWNDKNTNPIIILAIKYKSHINNGDEIHFNICDESKKQHFKIGDNIQIPFQYSWSQRIAFSVSPQCSFPNPYHVNFNHISKILLFSQRKTNALILQNKAVLVVVLLIY